jgi:Asp-tRNA(Asn)/Glu-tRNA(Gln) amidotransferase A subunit family amidase
VERREEVVRAWVALDETRLRGGGWTIGVKDIFATADFPTEYGSPIYAGHQTRGDAAAVALLRAAGAVIVGKTVTAELAMFTPGPTTNPHRTTHTPGGSSSGSAAAVAAGMVDAAIGTQTGGSVIRPASFCGVFGFKPTFGRVNTAGVKPLSPSLDTVGWFARDLDMIDRVRVAVTGRPPAPPSSGGTGDGELHVALLRTEMWDDASADSQRAVLAAAAHLGASKVPTPDVIDGLAADQPVVQAYESVRSLAWERATHPDLLSDGTRDILEWGAAIDADKYDRVRARAAAANAAVATVFGGADVLLTPAATGEAPEGLASTGDPRFCRLWNLLGWPAISVPGAVGDTGLPIGVQLVGRPGTDAHLIAAARRLEGAWL